MSKDVQIEIQAKGFEISDQFKRSIQKRIRHSFRFHHRRMKKVVVRLFKTMNVRGHLVKSCRIQAISNGLPQLVTEKKSDSLSKAINSSISISSRSVSKHLHKLRQYRHVQSQIADRSFA